jgi:hypothetical protein
MRPDATCASTTSQIRSNLVSPAAVLLVGLMRRPPVSAVDDYDRAIGRNSSRGRRRETSQRDDGLRRRYTREPERSELALTLTH